jgi:hypothetical protein
MTRTLLANALSASVHDSLAPLSEERQGCGVEKKEVAL